MIQGVCPSKIEFEGRLSHSDVPNVVQNQRILQLQPKNASSVLPQFERWVSPPYLKIVGYW